MFGALESVCRIEKRLPRDLIANLTTLIPVGVISRPHVTVIYSWICSIEDMIEDRSEEIQINEGHLLMKSTQLT